VIAPIADVFEIDLLREEFVANGLKHRHYEDLFMNCVSFCFDPASYTRIIDIVNRVLLRLPAIQHSGITGTRTENATLVADSDAHCSSKMNRER
jgi:hypothetical protein